MAIEHIDSMILQLRSGDKLIPALTRATVQVATAAKQLCPVDTGRLRASIGFDVVADQRGPVGRVGSGIGVGGGDPVEYAAYVEFGTRFAAAQPYLRPALTQVLGVLASSGEAAA